MTTATLRRTVTNAKRRATRLREKIMQMMFDNPCFAVSEGSANYLIEVFLSTLSEERLREIVPIVAAFIDDEAPIALWRELWDKMLKDAETPPQSTEVVICMGDGGISGVTGLPDNVTLQFHDYDVPLGAADDGRTVVVDPSGDSYEVVDIAQDF